MAALLIRPQQVAYFTTAFLLSATVLVIPYLLALALFAERAHDPELLHRHVRRTLPFALLLCRRRSSSSSKSPLPFVLRIFGPAYVANGTTALRLLVLVGPAYVIKDHYVAIRRGQGRITESAKVMALGTAAEAVGAASGAVLWGMNGLCLGWAFAATCEAALLTPSVGVVFRRNPAVAADTNPGPGDTERS